MNAGESALQPEYEHEQAGNLFTDVRLRMVQRDDLAILYEFQLDPAGYRMAFTRPRTADDFDAHWDKILDSSTVVLRAIVASDALVGSISCFQSDNQHYVGYWIGREFWGQGIATRALALLLDEVLIRPLFARVAVSNVASIRVLEKCGFRTILREWSPSTERFVECEEALMVLAD